MSITRTAELQTRESLVSDPIIDSYMLLCGLYRPIKMKFFDDIDSYIRDPVVIYKE
jgi:hypothetical protein